MWGDGGGKGVHGAWLGCACEQCQCFGDLLVLPSIISPALIALAHCGALLD